eukprot:6707078-Pyramimonas_sp.AAC.1
MRGRRAAHGGQGHARRPLRQHPEGCLRAPARGWGPVRARDAAQEHLRRCRAVPRLGLCVAGSQERAHPRASEGGAARGAGALPGAGGPGGAEA